MDQKPKPTTVSVVIPAFNEEQTIAKTISRVVDFFKKEHVEHELIVVDDGSTDGTLAEAKTAAATCDNIKVLQNGQNRGKGYTVKQGILQAKGNVLLFLDADYSTSIEEYTRFRPWLERGYALVIGSRRIPGADVGIHQHFVREFMGKVFTRISNLLLFSKVSDITCGFKCFQSAAAKELFKRQRLYGWSFDAEILFLAQKKGYRIKEIPVHWNNMPKTKVNLLRDALSSFWGLLKIKFYDFRGAYADKM